MRENAAELGVTQEAIHFKTEADQQVFQARLWGCATLVCTLVILVAAYNSMYLHQLSGLKPETSLQSYQLIASKVLFFGILSYGLVLVSRNFMSHKHNAVVNRHRQNALMTFKTLADAATDSKIKDVILTHAATCIFSPQDTGYTKGAGMSSLTGGKSVIELIGAVKGSE